MTLQPIMDGLVNGSIIGLGAIGVTLTYSILRFANFAHGEMLSWGAYLALTVSAALGAMLPGLGTPIGPFSFGWSVPIAMITSMVLTGLVALTVDWLLFGRLRKAGSAQNHSGDVVLWCRAGATQSAGIHLHLQSGLFHQCTADLAPHPSRPQGNT